MQTIPLQLDMCTLFDRVGEGVQYRYAIAVDQDSLMEHGVTPSNFVLQKGTFNSSDTRYLNGLRIDIDAWVQDAHDFLSQPNRDEVITTFLDLMEKPSYAWVRDFYAKWYE